ncbi:MAG: amidase [Thermodesulfobacteriota bacterium]
MSKYDELAKLDVLAQAELIKRKEVKAVELVEAAIARIESLNPALNAVVTPLFDQARAQAEKPQNGPLAGVPFLLKDILAFYQGARMTMGTKLLVDFVPDHDSELVARYKRAGLIILGKTNTPELGLLPTTEPRLLGPTRNPWDPSRTTGGSSGGAAAAVASGMVAAAHGNDGGGSIRIPSSCCGVFGLKPTRARNPLGPDFGDVIGGLVAEHALTRTVRDSAALLDATRGPEPGDPYWAPPPAHPYSEEVGADPGRLRIAFTTTNVLGAPVHGDCVTAVQDAAKLCEHLGHTMIEAALGLDGNMLAHAFTVIWLAGCAETIEGISLLTGRKPGSEDYEPLTWAMYEKGSQHKATEYMMAWQILQRTAREVAKFFADYDLLLTPTVAEPPVPLGSFDSPPEDPWRGWVRAASFAPFTPICNATGQPAMSVPLYWNKEGLPVGVHFIGRFGDEATLFRLAAQLEQARPWAGRRPGISA